MSKIYSSKDAARETFQRLTDLLSGTMKPGIQTGFKRLDANLHGFQPGTVTVLASKPSIGKTAYALNIVWSIFHNDKNVRILYYSLDLDHIQLMTRLLCMESGLEVSRIQQSDFSPDDVSRLTAPATWAKDLPLWIDPSCGISIEELDRKIREFLAKQPLDLIVIDPLELLKYEETPTAVKTIRQIAKEFQIPILLLATCHSRNKHCKIQDLAEGIADTSDTVMFLERERKPLTDGKKAPVELVIARNTCGFTGTIQMEYEPQTMIFAEIKQEEYEE